MLALTYDLILSKADLKLQINYQVEDLLKIITTLSTSKSL